MAPWAQLVSNCILNLISELAGEGMQASVLETRKTYTGRALQAMDLLANGMSETIVAEALGVSIGLVSQFMQEESFAEQVAARKAVKFAKQLETDNNIAEMELKATTRLAKMVDFITDTDKLIRIAQFANGAKLKTAPSGPGNGDVNIGTVNLVLPNVIKQIYTTNANNEVIAIAGQTLLPIQAKELDTALNSRELRNRKLTAEDIRNVEQL
jgi:predicted transcriptional regulator